MNNIICTVCGEEAADCECGDIDDRLKALTQRMPLFAALWCHDCDRIEDRCVCGDEQ